MDSGRRMYHPIQVNNTLFKLFPEYKKYKEALKTAQDFGSKVTFKYLPSLLF